MVTNCVPAVGVADTCDGPDTRGLLLVFGPPTKAATAVAIRCTSSAELPAGGWAPVWFEAVELSSVLSGVSAVGVELIIAEIM